MPIDRYFDVMQYSQGFNCIAILIVPFLLIFRLSIAHLVVAMMRTFMTHIVMMMTPHMTAMILTHAKQNSLGTSPAMPVTGL